MQIPSPVCGQVGQTRPDASGQSSQVQVDLIRYLGTQQFHKRVHARHKSPPEATATAKIHKPDAEVVRRPSQPFQDYLMLLSHLPAALLVNRITVANHPRGNGVLRENQDSHH